MSQSRLPAAVYWRRRLLLLAGVIAIVWVAVQLVGGSGDDESSSPAGSTPTPTATDAPAATAKTNGIVEVALVSSSEPCDPEQVRVTPSVRPGQFTRDTVSIGLIVSSTSKVACTLEPADADLLTVISANDTAIWDSTVCKESLLTDSVPVSPQWSSFALVEWSGRGSGSACSGKEGWATPGSYTVQVGTLGGEPGKTSFTIEAKPAPKKTRATPKPTPERTTARPADE